MAGDDEGGGGARPFLADSFIWDKWGPLPAWAWMGLGLGAAVIYSSWMRNKSANDAPVNDPTAAAGDVAGRLPFNSTAPNVWKMDVFSPITNNIPAPTVINPAGPVQTIPPAPPGGGRPDPPGAQPPAYLKVLKGWHVSQWIEDQKDPKKAPTGNPTLTWTLLESLNPGISKNVKWSADPAKTTFINEATYRVK